MPRETELILETFYARGQLRYKCPAIWPPAVPGEGGRPCEFDSYSPEKVIKHMETTHGTKAEAEATRFNLFESEPDAESGNGRPGEVEIIGDNDFESAVRESKRKRKGGGV